MITAERRGTWIYYRIVPAALADLADILGGSCGRDTVQPRDERRRGGRRGPVRTRGGARAAGSGAGADRAGGRPRAGGLVAALLRQSQALLPCRLQRVSGFPFRGDPERYPPRAEVVDYLRDYAATLDVDIRTACRVTSVAAAGERGFVVTTDTGDEIHTAAVVAATGSFGRPHLPALLGQHTFTGRLLHVADYRRPEHYVDQRVVVVGAGDSAVQVGYELAQVADGHHCDASSPRLPSPTDRRQGSALLARADRLRRPSSRMACPAHPGHPRHRHRPLPRGHRVGSPRPTPDVHRAGRRARHLVRRHARSGRHHRSRHRLPARPRLPAASSERSPTDGPSTPGGSPPHIRAWPTSASSFNVPTRRTPSGACTATPTTSRRPSPPTCETRAPSSGCDPHRGPGPGG